jgi:cytochrome c oxidase subunit I
MLIVVAMAYVIPLTEFIVNAPPGSPPFKTW